MERLWAPWRMAYIDKDEAGKQAASENSERCVFCEKPLSPQPDQELIVRKGEAAYVLMNLYPYNTGHLMIIPYEHQSRYELLDAAVLGEMSRLAQQAITAIESALKPHGFNIGLNQGSAAGAGIAAHLHMHIVPRWEGDANFMPVIGEVKVMPDSLENTYRKITQAWNE